MLWSRSFSSPPPSAVAAATFVSLRSRIFERYLSYQRICFHMIKSAQSLIVPAFKFCSLLGEFQRSYRQWRRICLAGVSFSNFFLQTVTSAVVEPFSRGKKVFIRSSCVLSNVAHFVLPKDAHTGNSSKIRTLRQAGYICA
jgi:hypothetical protein